MAKQGRTGKPGKAARRLRRVVCVLLAFGFVTGMTSCTRRFFRQAADREVNEVLSEKDQYPAWGIQQFHIYPDPRARFADPTNPEDRKSTRLNSSHLGISYAVFCLKKKNKHNKNNTSHK